MSIPGTGENQDWGIEGAFGPSPEPSEQAIHSNLDQQTADALNNLARKNPTQALEHMSQGLSPYDIPEFQNHEFGQEAEDPMEPKLEPMDPALRADIRREMDNPLRDSKSNEIPEADLDLDKAKATFEQFVKDNLPEGDKEALSESLNQLQENLSTMSGIKREIETVKNYKLKSYKTQIKMISSLGSGGLMALQYGTPLFVYAGAAMAALHLIDAYKKGQIGGHSKWNHYVEEETDKLKQLMKHAESSAAASMIKAKDDVEQLPEEEKERALREQADLINTQIQNILSSLSTEVSTTSEGLRVNKANQEGPKAKSSSLNPFRPPKTNAPNVRRKAA